MAFKGRFVLKPLDKKTYTGTPTTTAEHYQITKDEVRALFPKMAGLPMRYEHKNIVIGSVVKPYYETDGSACIDFELHDTKPGKLAKQWIEDGSMRGLSLHHRRVPLEPVEVSLCLKGARAGTGVFEESVYKSHLDCVPCTVAASSSDEPGNDYLLFLEMTDTNSVLASDQPQTAATSTTTTTNTHVPAATPPQQAVGVPPQANATQPEQQEPVEVAPELKNVAELADHSGAVSDELKRRVFQDAYEMREKIKALESKNAELSANQDKETQQVNLMACTAIANMMKLQPGLVSSDAHKQFEENLKQGNLKGALSNTEALRGFTSVCASATETSIKMNEFAQSLQKNDQPKAALSQQLMRSMMANKPLTRDHTIANPSPAQSQNRNQVQPLPLPMTMPNPNLAQPLTGASIATLLTQSLGLNATNGPPQAQGNLSTQDLINMGLVTLNRAVPGLTPIEQKAPAPQLSRELAANFAKHASPLSLAADINKLVPARTMSEVSVEASFAAMDQDFNSVMASAIHGTEDPNPNQRTGFNPHVIDITCFQLIEQGRRTGESLLTRNLANKRPPSGIDRFEQNKKYKFTESNWFTDVSGKLPVSFDTGSVAASSSSYNGNDLNVVY